MLVQRKYPIYTRETILGQPISSVDYELTQEGFSRTCFPGGTSEIRLETKSIVYIHRNGQRLRITLENGGVSDCESFSMKAVFPRFR